MADGKSKYPIAEAAKRKTTKVIITSLTCSFFIGLFDTSFITIGFINENWNIHITVFSIELIGKSNGAYVEGFAFDKLQPRGRRSLLEKTLFTLHDSTLCWATS